MSGTSSSFHIANGQIIAPNGQAFIAKGINVRWDQLDAVVGNGTNMPLLADFPGLNMVRVNYEDSGWQDPSAIAAAVNALTAKGIVVEIEDHTGISATPYTGSQLAAEQAWYSTLATTFKNNPYVWFGTFNEPGQGTDLAGIAAQELATYNTIRAAGNNNPILMEEPSGGNPGLVGANAAGYDSAGPMSPSDYSQMTNIIWDLHYYGWVSNYSTNGATVAADLQGSAGGASGIAGAQTITSADGTVPVIIGEFGNSTTGGAIDANGDQVIQAVTQSGHGYLAWGWDPDEQGDQLTTDSGQMTGYGQQIAAAIGSTAATPPATPTPTPTPTPSSKEITTTSGGTLTDAAGNKWTLTSAGIVDENGTAVPGSSGTAAVAIVNNVIYGQDATSKSWYTYSPTSQSWTGSAAPVLTTAPLLTTATSVTIAANQASTTVSSNDVSVNATAGNHMVFISGTGDTVNLTGGTETITDTGSANTYVIPPAGKGYDTFTSNVFTSGDTLDLRTALAATNWNGSASALPNYLSVTSSGSAAVLSIASASGGTATGIATIDGASGTTLSNLLAHALT
jgi:hypothetical protein